MVLLRTGAVSLGIALTGFCYLTSMALKVLLVPQSIKMYIAPAIHNYYRQEMYTRIHKLVYEQKPRASAQLLYTKLALCCPAIKSVIIRQTPDRCACITVHSMAPIMRVILYDTDMHELTHELTAGYVLTNAHNFVPTRYFESLYLEQLPCLYIVSYSALSHLEHVFKKQPLLFTQEFFDHYKIIWHSSQKIVLELKQAPGCNIITSQELLTSKKRIYAEQLCLHSYKTRGDKRVIDIRFGNYLVCT